MEDTGRETEARISEKGKTFECCPCFLLIQLISQLNAKAPLQIAEKILESD